MAKYLFFFFLLFKSVSAFSQIENTGQDSLKYSFVQNVVDIITTDTTTQEPDINNPRSFTVHIQKGIIHLAYLYREYKFLSMEDLKKIVQKERGVLSGKNVFIVADKDTHFDIVKKIITIFTDSHIYNFQLVTKSP